MSFRKKIILTQVILFIVFFAALFPFVEKMAFRLVRDSLIETTTDLKKRLENAPTFEELVNRIQTQNNYSFFRISLIDDKGLVVFDTHFGRLYGPQFQPYRSPEHVEVKEALEKGVGYIIAKSDTFGVRFAYVAETFTFQGKTYILRTAFPYEQILDLTKNFQVSVLIFSFVILLFFNTLIWLTFNRFTRPIREIVQAITPYSSGIDTQLPEIHLTRAKSPHDEFQRLANTFNSLSHKIQEQFDVLKTERNEKEAILESLGEGVVAVNGKLEVVYINFLACKMLELSKKAILYKSLPPDTPLLDKCTQLLKVCQQKQTIITDSFHLQDEKKTTIDLIAAPKAEGTGAIIVLQDKTAHYQALEIGKDFVANASHELRTPITIIKGYAETLHDVETLSQTQLKEITEKIGRSCERMENLVYNLLTLADIDNLSSSRFKECDLIPILENGRHTLLSVYPDAQIVIDKSVDTLTLAADAGLLELAFLNLLDNAAKYSTPPAHITLTVTTQDEEALIKVQDRGKGIPPEDLAHIFERFYRVDKTHSRKLGGAGLGLSIVKTIIEKHDGTIRVASEPGQGTTFTLTLPLRHHGRL